MSMATTTASNAAAGLPQDPSANQLNRELLRWIQSLDLAYSIKNVKRDFSNGFLVAEILSRYYDKDISMHSYDNGIGLKVKKDNWDQLHRVFSRIADLEPLTARAELDAIIHCQNGAAVAFLTKLYQCLTKRTIQATVAVSNNHNTVTASAVGVGASAQLPSVARARDPVEEIPPYAKPTGTAVIREKMRAADIAETSDESSIHRKVRDIHAQHEEHLQLERLLADAPDRYPSLRSASKATVLRGATKPVRNDEGPALVAQNVVKEVQIKSMNEKSLEKLRMNREAKDSELGANGNVGGIGASFDHIGRTTGGHHHGASAGELIQRRRPLDLLNEAVTRKLAPGLVSRLDQRGGKERIEGFLDALRDGRLVGDVEGAGLLEEVLDDPSVLAQAFLDFPKEFWRVTALLFPFVLENEDEHPLFVATHHALLRIGKQCVRRDGAGAMVMMTECLLPKITSILEAYATKRAPLLQVVYAFAPETVLAHIQVIKRLREALPDNIPLFIHALSILLCMEPELDDTLVDLYHYYCCIGLETPCDKLRAAALSMLRPFIPFDLSLVADLLPRLTQFSSRFSWWEVKTQLVIVASAFLYAANQQAQRDPEARDLTSEIELALTILEREFHPRASLSVRRIGVSYLAKNLGQYQELVPLYVDVLLSLPPALRSPLIHAPDSTTTSSMSPESGDDDVFPRGLDALPLRGASGAHYALAAVTGQWDALAIAKQIYYERKDHGRADFDALDVLLACTRQLERDGAFDQLRGLYLQMRDYLVLGLLDAAGCGPAAEILSRVAIAGAVGPEAVVVEHPRLLEFLARVVSRNVDDIRQQAAVKMLQGIRAVGPVHAAAVGACVESLRRVCEPALFDGSLLAIAF